MANKSIHDKRYKAIIEQLIDVRKDKGLTQQQVADKLFKPQSFVAKYENCERRLDVVELDDIAKVFGVKISTLLD